MKKYLILLAGLILVFNACKKKDTGGGGGTAPAPVACFEGPGGATLKTLIDSAQVDTFDASCSQNAVSYAWLDIYNSPKGTGKVWTNSFTTRSNQPNPIRLTVTNTDGATNATSIGIICGFHQLQSFTVNAVPDSIKANGFYIVYGPISGTANAQTAVTKVTSLPVTIPLAAPLSIKGANANNGEWKIQIITAAGTPQSFIFYPGNGTTTSPYARTMNVVNDKNYNFNVNYTISQN